MLWTDEGTSQSYIHVERIIDNTAILSPGSASSVRQSPRLKVRIKLVLYLLSLILCFCTRCYHNSRILLMRIYFSVAVLSIILSTRMYDCGVPSSVHSIFSNLLLVWLSYVIAERKMVLVRLIAWLGLLLPFKISANCHRQFVKGGLLW